MIEYEVGYYEIEINENNSGTWFDFLEAATDEENLYDRVEIYLKECYEVYMRERCECGMHKTEFYYTKQEALDSMAGHDLRYRDVWKAQIAKYNDHYILEFYDYAEIDMGDEDEG